MTKPHICRTLLALGLLAPLAEGATILDWSDWDASWVSGNFGPQVLDVGGGQEITYDGSVNGVNMNVPAPDVITFATTGYALNGTGGAPDHYLDLDQSFATGNDRSVHNFRMTQGVENLRISLWDIDSGGNYIDEVRVHAWRANGDRVDPSEAYIENAAYVQQVSSSTWSGIDGVAADDQSDDGNLMLSFYYPDIVRVRVQYRNSHSAFGGGGRQILGIYNIESVAIPEPASWMLVVLGVLTTCCGRRRRRAKA